MFCPREVRCRQPEHRPNCQASHRRSEVHVCSQALASNEIARDAANPAIQIDAAALTTLANLQLLGYAMIPD